MKRVWRSEGLDGGGDVCCWVWEKGGSFDDTLSIMENIFHVTMLPGRVSFPRHLDFGKVRCSYNTR